ncbi:MAG: nicotinate-nucleotide pyrophosphorylase (carboxylating) [Rhodothermales bacterium]|jgi:nicotinate-nucleotide pyrophosphorylase (carboxylating)
MDRRLNPQYLKSLVRAALAEDIGEGDATTLAVVPDDVNIDAEFRARETCVIAGLPVVAAVFHELDSSVELSVRVAEGERCGVGQVAAVVSGSARAILTGERTALNFMQRLSGIATQAAEYAAACAGTKVRILDTRKTTPGLRALEKYAVAVGGAENHRFGLYDRIMIKDNHRLIAGFSGTGAIGRAVAACREQYPNLEIEVEADTLEEVEQALRASAEYVLLDNMSDEQMRLAHEARNRIAKQSLLEASGGITIERIAEIAKTGVDFISVGALTHSVRAIDIGLDIDEPERGA